MTILTRIIALLVVATFLVAAPRSTVAQAGSDGLRPNMLGVWGGLSFNSMAGNFLASTPNRDFHELGVRISWQLLSAGWAGLDYTFDIIPAAVVTNNPVYAGDVFIRGNTLFVQSDAGRESMFGLGAAPIGFRVWVGGKLRLFASGSAGFLVFNGAVPTVGASEFNFTFDFGGGAEVRVNNLSMFGGYKLHHISNGNSTYLNPGIDSNVFYAGIGWIYP